MKSTPYTITLSKELWNTHHNITLSKEIRIKLVDHVCTQNSNRLIEHDRHSSSFSLFPVDRPIRQEMRAVGEKVR